MTLLGLVGDHPGDGGTEGHLMLLEATIAVVIIIVFDVVVGVVADILLFPILVGVHIVPCYGQQKFICGS